MSADLESELLLVRRRRHVSAIISVVISVEKGLGDTAFGVLLGRCWTSDLPTGSAISCLHTYETLGRRDEFACHVLS